MKFETLYENRKPLYVTELDYDTKLVDQSEADAVSLDYQLKRFGMDGLTARFELMKSQFGYADTRLIPSYSELSNRIAKGTEYFNALPSEIRRQFSDKPENFFDYLENNPKEAIEKGYISDEYTKYMQDLFVKKDVETPVSVDKQENVTSSEVVSENLEN